MSLTIVLTVRRKIKVEAVSFSLLKNQKTNVTCSDPDQFTASNRLLVAFKQLNYPATDCQLIKTSDAMKAVQGDVVKSTSGRRCINILFLISTKGFDMILS